MEYIKYRFFQKASKCSKEFQRIKEQFGDKVIAQITLEQVLSGLKGIPLLVTDTSKLDPNEESVLKVIRLMSCVKNCRRLYPQASLCPKGCFI